MKVIKKVYRKLANVLASVYGKLEISKVIFCSSVVASRELWVKGETLYLCKLKCVPVVTAFCDPLAP